MPFTGRALRECLRARFSHAGRILHRELSSTPRYYGKDLGGTRCPTGASVWAFSASVRPTTGRIESRKARNLGVVREPRGHNRRPCRSEEHTSAIKSPRRHWQAVLCL